MRIRTIRPPGSGVSDATRCALLRRIELSRSFLVVGLGFSFHDLASSGEPPPRTICSLNQPRAEFRPLLLLDANRRVSTEVWRSADAGRFELVLGDLRESESHARRIVGALDALFVAYTRIVSQDFEVYRLPTRFVQKGAIRKQTLLRLEQIVRRYSVHVGTEHSLLWAIYVTEDATLKILFHLPAVLQTPELFDACHFFKEAFRDFTFLGDTVREVLSDPNRTAATESDRVRLESLVHHAYRAVEALLGEPGKDRNRYRARMHCWGLDYGELVGFGGMARAPLGDRLYWLRDLRDLTAAHSRRGRRAPLTLMEAMEAQDLAYAVITTAVWHTSSQRGRPEGSDAELTFLLTRMFAGYVLPDWFASAQPELETRTPAQAVRKPGGLDRLLSVLESLPEDRRPTFAQMMDRHYSK